MSPLTFTLLALAALLVAAEAQNNCNQMIKGTVSKYAVPLPTVYTPPGGGRVSFEDVCPMVYGLLWASMGDTVTACNVDPKGEAPDIQQVDPLDLSPVDVICTRDLCPQGAKVDITLYCLPLITAKQRV